MTRHKPFRLLGRREGSQAGLGKIAALANEGGHPSVSKNRVMGWVPGGHGIGGGPSGLKVSPWLSVEQDSAIDQVPSSKLGHRAGHQTVRT